MTAPDPMTREELIELAAMDAFGLLDEYEAALYTRSFHHAPAAVQDEIRELQAKIAAEDSFLPDEEPDPAQRDRVLAAVASAIEAESHEFAPLATIGRRGGDTVSTDIAGRIRPMRSAQFWRAACFALIAGLVISLYFLGSVYRHANNVSVLALSDGAEDELVKAIGPDFGTFIALVGSGDCDTIPFNANGPTRGSAIAFVDRNTLQLFVLTMALPETEEEKPYGVQVTIDGKSTVLGSLASTGSVSAIRIDDLAESVSANMLASAVFEITSATGTVLLTTG